MGAILHALIAMVILAGLCLLVLGGLILLLCLCTPKTPEYQEWNWGDDEIQ